MFKQMQRTLEEDVVTLKKQNTFRMETKIVCVLVSDDGNEYSVMAIFIYYPPVCRVFPKALGTSSAVLL